MRPGGRGEEEKEEDREDERKKVEDGGRTTKEFDHRYILKDLKKETHLEEGLQFAAKISEICEDIVQKVI
jgi:hypothetical protein